MEIKGIKYVGPIFDGCYDYKTEVLTDSGWKFFKDINYEDKICTLNDKQCIEYHEPSDIINKMYSGDMYHFKSKQSKIDLLVTPNHNMYVQTSKGRQNDKIHELYVNTYGIDKLSGSTWNLELARTIVNKTRYFKKDANYVKDPVESIEVCGRNIEMDIWLEFLGYYLSEGSSTIYNKHYIVQIRQFGKNLLKMANALSKVTLNKVNIIEKDGRVVVNDKELCLYLNKKFGNVYNKHIPRFILNNCSKKQLNILFESLMLGDGHDLRNNYKFGKVSGGSSYNTSSLRLKDDFMELLLKIGYSGTSILKYKKGDVFLIYNRVCTAGADHWNILIRFSNNVCVMSDKTKFFVDKINYNGTVHCVTVKNHTLYVRRNGMVVWSGNSGYAQACRGNILALHEIGVPITLSPISFDKIKPDLGKSGEILKKLIDKNIDYNVVFIHSTPEFWSRHREKNKINIGYTIWETTKLHPDWKDYINDNVDKVLVGCTWNEGVFRNSGITIPIGVVPHGISISEFDNVKPYNIAGVSSDAYVFYSIFQFTERKHPVALMKAYWYAFQNNENVALVLKTYRNDYSENEKEVIRSTIKRMKHTMPLPSNKPHAKIYFIPDMLTNDEILGLHDRGDCYTSLDRGEGFGLSPFTAGAVGNPIIVTGFGGSTEYAKPDNSYLVNYSLSPVFGMPYSPWYMMDQLWAEPDIIHGAELMRHVYENREESKEKGLKLKNYINESFSWECIGKKIVKEIELL